MRPKHGAYYLITFTDGYIYKSKELHWFRCYMNIVKNWKEKTITALRINHGHEYPLKSFKNLYDEKEIQRTINSFKDSIVKWLKLKKVTINFWIWFTQKGTSQLFNIFWGGKGGLLFWLQLKSWIECPQNQLLQIHIVKKPNLTHLWSLGLAGLVHVNSHRYCAIKETSALSLHILINQRFVMLSEQLNGSIIEIKSYEVNFL